MPRPSPIDRAIVVAAQAHSRQRRKDTDAPYIVHPVEVLKRLADLGVREVDVLCAAVLHDVVEDTDASLGDVQAEFGATVAGYVDEMTHDPNREDKVQYLARFTRRSAESLAIKLVDRAANVDDYARERPDYAPQYARKAEPVYDAVESRESELAKAFGDLVGRRLVGEARRLRAFGRKG